MIISCLVVILSACYNFLAESQEFLPEKQGFYLKSGTPEIVYYETEQKSLVKINGKTNLPDSSVITLFFYYIPSCSGQETDKRMVELKKYKIDKGVYQAEFGPFRGKLNSGTYVITVTFDPAKQYKEVKAIIGDNPEGLKQEIKLCRGTDDDMLKEIKQSEKAIRDNADALKSVFQSISEAFHNQITLKTVDKNAWREYLIGFHKELSAISDRTMLIDPLNAFNSVLKGKVFIGAFVQELEMLSELCDKTLSAGERVSSDKYEFVLKTIEKIKTDFEAEFIQLGIEMGNKKVIIEQISIIENHFAFIQKEIIGQNKSVNSEEWHDWFEKEKDALNKVLLDISSNPGLIKYKTISEIIQDVVVLWKIMESDDENMAEEFDEKLTQLQKVFEKIKNPPEEKHEEER
ncbi:MAG: hypothetical protein HY811_00935 [Planctomycetes bacterium]|nr:hypothetical protein [Planctomycetota bacterium]